MSLFDGIRRAVSRPPARPKDIERDIDDELRFHLEMRAAKLRARGLSATEAAAEARRRFGNTTRVRDECVAEDIPALRRANLAERIDDLTRDTRIAARTLQRTPGFAIAAATLLALGIGGTTSVFSIVNAVYFRPMPYPNADRLALLQAAFADPLCDRRCARAATAPEVAEWRKHATTLESIGTIELRQGPVSTPAGTIVLEGGAVSREIPTLLGLRASLGRALVAADFADGANPVMVVSHSAWLAEFSGDSSIVGRVLTSDDVSYRVVGVLARESELGPPIYSFNVRTAEYLVPQAPWPKSIHQVVGLVKPGADRGTAALELSGLLKNANGAEWQANVQWVREALATRYRGSFAVLLAAALVVLLLTCMNVGGLLVARLNDRMPELATRAVLGAGRARLVQHVLIETSLIATMGAAGGLLVGFYGTRAARLIPAERLPFWTPVMMDARVVLLAVTIAIVGVLALSIAPIVALSPARIATGLRELVTTPPSRARVRRVVVGVEIALSVVLFGIAGILIKQLVAAEARDLGSAKRSVVFVALASRSTESDASWPDRIVAGLRTLSGVKAVAVSGMPKRMIASTVRRDTMIRRAGPVRRAAVFVEGRADPVPDLVLPMTRVVTADFFVAAGLPLIAGHAFGPSDNASSQPVAIVNAAAARRAFGKESAVGKRIRIEAGGSTGDWLTIVGVTTDQRSGPFATTISDRAELYRPWGQVEAQPGNIAIRVAGDSRHLAPQLRAAIHAIDPQTAVASIAPIETWFDKEMWPARFTTDILTTFAVFALVLACLGVYATVSYVVGRRRRELAIRVAVGATGRDVVASVLRSSLPMVGIGVGAGLAGAFAAARLLRAMLYGSSGVDVVVLLAAALGILAAGIVAAYLPARRAASADPLVALRAD